MAKIYISSTFKDLVEYREAVYRALRKMQLEVVAMEDYVARDDRPLDACLADVAASDIYVGIFAWRYGFVPDEDNPEGRSITELEYRHAVGQRVPALNFLLSEDVPWPPSSSDSHTGDGEVGAKIRALRGELGDEHMVSFFRNPDHLASLVQSAVSVRLAETGDAAEPPRRERAVLHRREITHSLLLAHADADEALATRLLGARQGGAYIVPEPLLFATEADELESLEAAARSCDRAAVMLSRPTLDRLVGRAEESLRVLSLLRTRTGRLEAFCASAAVAELARQLLPFDDAHDLSALGPGQLRALVADDPALAVGRRIGLPYVVVAMTRSEAEQLEQNPELIELALDRRARVQFEELRRSLSQYGHLSLSEHYGERREDWRPFSVDAGSGGAAPGLDALLLDMVERLEKAKRPRLRGRRLKPQLYSFDALVDDDAALRPIYGDVAESGCLAIVDELSLCHPRISRAAGQLFGKRQVAIVTISPLDPRQLPPYRLLERELSRSLGFAFDRFDRDLDPHCEVGVGNARMLKRWLFNSLPATAARLFEPEPDSASLSRFARELNLEDDESLAPDFYSEGGGL